jgi:hypothetical protein
VMYLLLGPMPMPHCPLASKQPQISHAIKGCALATAKNKTAKLFKIFIFLQIDLHDGITQPRG